jgi:quinoprotein glucose dehydrogenase
MIYNMKLNSCLLLLTVIILIDSCKSHEEDKYNSWKVYGGNKTNNHYSSLSQIDTANVSQLQAVWAFHTGDSGQLSQMQVNPIIIDSVLYCVSPRLKLFALDAVTGMQKWVFDPLAEQKDTTEKKPFWYFLMNVCRGVAYYTDGKDDRRIFYSTAANLRCIDAKTGMPILNFGNRGKVDLHEDLGRDVKDLYVASTTPGIIYKDMIVVGTRVAEDAAAAPGHIRAYDVHTGKLRWIFHTIPYPGEEGYESWDNKEAYKHIGGANAWSGLSLDEENGIIFAPIGSSSYDFYGGKRTGNGLFSNSVVALDANTGKRIWHFQTYHHDVWDRDPPTAPIVATITKDGKKIEAVVQVTKSAFVYLFDRHTGQPIYPVKEMAVPTETALVGEKLSPTQPVPELPLPFARQSLTEKDLNQLVPDSSYQDIKVKLAGYKTGNMFNPPSPQGTVIFPGFDGGAEWGGPAFDPTTGILYVNSSEMPWVLTMTSLKDKPKKTETNLEAGQRLYKSFCMSCHGTERQGGGNYPTLVGVEKTYHEPQFMQLVSSGRRMMPAFGQLAESEKKALASFILNLRQEQNKKFEVPARPENEWFVMPYTSTGYNKFLTKEGYPAVNPPWGTLNAIDLATGQYIWKDTLGDYPEFKARGIHTGTENYGGPVVTAGGILFIAATSDSKIRAFNKRNGQLLWEYDLPACGFATPAVYEIGGKEFLVIACGGGKLGKPSGDAYVAFSLPTTN